MPYEIGGGPASPLEPIMISRDFFERTLHCDHNCAACDYSGGYRYSLNNPRMPGQLFVQLEIVFRNKVKS